MPIKIRVLEEEDAADQIIELIGQRRIVRINGHSGHGKTRLAKAVAAKLGWARVSVDEYLPQVRRRGPFVELINVERLHQDVLTAVEHGLVVEGIWLDALVPVDTFGPELKVYMLSLFGPEFEQDERRRKRQLGTNRYHADHRPDLFAEILVLKAAG